MKAGGRPGRETEGQQGSPGGGSVPSAWDWPFRESDSTQKQGDPSYGPYLATG